MICRKCGADIPEGDQACPACGEPLADAPVEAEETVQVPEEVADAPEETVDAPDAVPADAADDPEAPEHVADADEGDLASGMEYRTEGEEPLAPEAPKKKRGGLIAVVAVVVAAAVAAGAWFLLSRKAPTAMDRVVEMVDCLPENATDVAMETIGVPGDTVMLTVGDREITAEEYLYWLGNITSYYDMISSYSGGAMDLTQEAQDGVTWDQQLKLAARDNAVLLALVPTLAEEYGVELTDEDLQKVIDDRASGIESAGGEEMYAYQLQSMGISDASALRLEATSALYSKVQEVGMEKAKGALLPEEVAAYVEANDLLRAKHILLLTQDMATGEVYDDAKKAEQKAKADDLLAQLRADGSKFDELMNANSEDTGLSSYPDGYLFTAGELVPEFEEGTRALAVGEISEVIESDYGYHIILRLDPDCDEVRQELASTRFNDEVQARVDEAEVVESEAYTNLTTADYYEKLKAFQETLTQPEVVDQSQAELQAGDQTEPEAEGETEPAAQPETEPTAQPEAEPESTEQPQQEPAS